MFFFFSCLWQTGSETLSCDTSHGSRQRHEYMTIKASTDLTSLSFCWTPSSPAGPHPSLTGRIVRPRQSQPDGGARHFDWKPRMENLQPPRKEKKKL